MLNKTIKQQKIYQDNHDWRSQCPFCQQISMFKISFVSDSNFSTEMRINCRHLRLIVRSEDNKLENTVVQYEDYVNE
jgi:hypothetical protein